MVRNVTAMLFGIAILACCVSPAAAQRYKYPPGPPYRSCPGTPTIFDVEQTDTTLAPCHPAILDTVVGVRGIITGMDARPSAYGFYIQTGGAFTGVDIFTGATNYNAPPASLAVGDLVEVTGTTQEFPNPNGTTEIEGPDVVQSTNDIIITKISSGNALPAFAVGTTHDYNWIPGVSAATAEPREGCLVRINGPLHVARVATGLGVQGNNFLITNTATPTDSVLIDGFTLALFGTPPLNSAIDFVQGILNQNTGQSVNSYRIQLRDGNDISLAAPPNLVEAYPLEDNKLRLIYDKNLFLTAAQDESNYSLGSGINGSTVDLATLVGGAGTTVELDITSVLVDGDAETVTSQNVGSATCPLCLEPSQTLNFGQGVIPISLIQKADPLNLSPCDDRSKFAGPGTAFGTRIVTRGVAVQSYGSLYYIQDAAGGQRSGVSIFGPLAPLITGHTYRIACRAQEFGGETEIVNTVNILDEGVVAVPSPITQTIAVLSDTACDNTVVLAPGRNLETAQSHILTGEDFEGVLVHVNESVVVPFSTPPTDPVPGGSFLIAQPVKAPTDTILVSSLGGHYTFDADPGMIVNVTGVLHASGLFRILPRSDADIVFMSTGVGSHATDLALNVTPNPGTAHRISYALPKKDRVELGVYDLAGRKVAVIASGVMEAGQHSSQWNGMASNGSRAGAGMYFYRLKVGDETRTLRAVKLN